MERGGKGGQLGAWTRKKKLKLTKTIAISYDLKKVLIALTDEFIFD